MAPRIWTLVVLAATVSGQAPTWIDRGLSKVHIGPSYRFALAYHEIEKTIYGFGRGYGGTYQTWTWNGSLWKLMDKIGPRGYRQLVYDTKRNRLVLFSHSAGGTGSFYTHEWIGGKWVQQSPTGGGPNVQFGFGVAYDSGRAVSVLFGGAGKNGTVADTWEYDGTKWEKRSSGGPGHRHSHGIAFDEARGEVVVFGGLRLSSSNDLLYRDTWVWNGSYWRERVNAGSPGSRYRSSMTYDPARKRVIHYGGRDFQNFYGDTWEWDGTGWQKIPTVVSPKGLGFMAFDQARGVAVLQISEVSGYSPGTKTMEYLYKPPAKAAFIPFGSGCATSAGIPELAGRSGSVPRIGGRFGLDVTVLPTSQFTRVMGLIGTSKTNWGSIPLPLDLIIVGMPGCRLLIAHEFSPQSLPILNGVAEWNFAIPNDPSLAGGTFYLQAMVLTPRVNAFGAVMTNAGTGTLGF